ENGWYGPTCTTACPALHCGAGEVVCDRDSGATIACESCADGFSGERCDQAPYTSCLAWRDAGATEDRTYWIDADGPGGPIPAVEVYCDMTNGGYTYLKVDYGQEATAVDAESYCAARGLQLFIPRTKAHLASAFAVATSGAIGPSGSKLYLYIMGIYPEFAGATCKNMPLHSGNPSCQWEASDGGTFWVSNRTDVAEPNSDNAVTSSMFYDFDDAGNAIAWNDTEVSYTSRYFICDTGDTDFLFASCKQWYDAAFQTDGTYLLDVDGRLGGAAPASYTCDMAGGGWTTVASENFASGTTSGWSVTNVVTTCGSWRMVGGYNCIGDSHLNENAKTYSWAAVPHTQAKLDLDFYKVDSWDQSETGYVDFAGQNVWAQNYCFCNQVCGAGAICGGADICGGTWPEERAAHVTATIAHTASSAQVKGRATINQESHDESWGFGNIVIKVR
ncbi:MAG: hypothetical protein KC635_24105, partial [Myxococcales bacterium]|nr:hypothetical protein [Myxococcales bacterium]